jgi:hypothetical protein
MFNGMPESGQQRTPDGERENSFPWIDHYKDRPEDLEPRQFERRCANIRSISVIRQRRTALIAIVLIAVIAVSAWTFGLFTSPRDSAQVFVPFTSSASCSNSGHNCTILVTNNGDTNVNITGGSINIGGASLSVPLTGIIYFMPILSGETQTVTIDCATANGYVAMPSVGSRMTGTLTESNNITVPWSAIVTS